MVFVVDLESLSFFFFFFSFFFNFSFSLSFIAPHETSLMKPTFERPASVAFFDSSPAIISAHTASVRDVGMVSLSVLLLVLLPLNRISRALWRGKGGSGDTVLGTS